MPLNLDANGCGIIRKHVYCPNNITEIYYDGHIRPSRDCTLDTCSLLVSNWGYLPNAPSNIFFAVVFGVFFILHIPLGLWKRTWGVLLGMTIGSSLEAVGYVGRTIAHSQPFSFNPFLIYIIFLTTAPAFLCAAIYVCLARIIVVYGESNARFRPTTYSIIFMFSDFIALVLQGAGGGLASVNSGKDQQKAQMGINIMIAGLAWQVVSLTLFTVAAADFVWCVKKGRGQPNQDFMALRQAKKFRAFMWSLGIQVLVIYLRSIYRVAELAEGFTGRIAVMEVPYMIFEPVMIFIACLCMTVLHPGLVFGNAWNQIDLIMKAHGKSQQKQSLGKNTPSSHSMSYNRREDPSGDYGLRS